MTTYTVVRYRPDGSDFCKGQIMGRSESQFEVFITNDQKEAKSKIVEWEDQSRSLVDSKINPEWRAYQTTDVILLIDGYTDDCSGHIVCGRIDDDAYDDYQEKIALMRGDQ